VSQKKGLYTGGMKVLKGVMSSQGLGGGGLADKKGKSAKILVGKNQKGGKKFV